MVNKILMQGMNSTAVSYGEYVENYLHSEHIYEGHASTDIDLINSKHKPSLRVYNVSNILNVFLHQTLFLLLIPIMAFREIFDAVKNSLMRDFYK